jgi:hypothetical protein
MAVNDPLIKQVFDAMLVHKPSLSKYLVKDEDEDEIDPRLLADQIVKNFPWPIGIELRRLFSGSMRTLDRGRLDQLFKTIERTIQFLSFILVISLYEEIRKKKIAVDSTFINQFKQRFTVLSLGNFTWLIRAIGKLLENQEAFFINEAKEVLNTKFYDSLDFWVPERNEIGHYQINLTDEETEKRCVEYTDRLTAILVALSFLIKYKLVTIREIKVLKKRNEEALYEHWMDMLNSSDSDFKSNEEILHSFSDSNAVLLMKSIKEPLEFLNLSPLIIDTRTEKIDSKEKFALRKDIFMYTKFRNDRLMYVGTEVTEKCDLSILSNYKALVNEFIELMNSITEEKAA